MAEDQNTETKPNDDQANALIAALVPKIAEAIIPSLTEKVEAQIKGVVDKNTELLGKLSASKTQTTNVEQQLATLSQQITTGQQPVTEVVIGKLDARNPAIYRAAKAKAEEAGVTLTIDRNA